MATFNGTTGNDSILGEAGDDTLTGGLGKDTLDGGAGNDRIFGEDGNDSLIGGLGNDNLHGELGNDTLDGGAGDDALDGGVDSVKDILIGGEGSDAYYIRDLKDTITEKGTINSAFDAILLADDFDDNVKKQIISYTLKNANIEVLDASGLLDFDGDGRGANLTGNAKAYTRIYGSGYNDSIVGGTAADRLEGNAGTDTLFGGNDKLEDILIGGSGNDTYVLVDENDTIQDSSEANTIVLSSKFKSADANLGLNDYAASNITKLDASAVSQALWLGANGSLDTTILAGKGKDTILGGDGVDIFHGNNGNDKLHGAGGNDFLYGDAGNDILEGGSGNNVLTGGKGNDTYSIDGTGSDILYEEAKGGIDTVQITAANLDTYSLIPFAEVENIDATGSQRGSGLVLRGNTSANTITGTEYSDWLYGGAGNDILNGGDGNDWLQGDEGSDKMVGGFGDDEYQVNSNKDTVVEAKLGGTDTVYIRDYDFIKNKSYTLGANIENLDLDDYDINIDDDDLEDAQVAKLEKNRVKINGNALNNEITVSDDFGNIMKAFGLGGNDSLYGGDQNDYLDGGVGDDYLYGYDGYNGGYDTLVGGAGNDTYRISYSDTNIIDTSGNDTVILDNRLSNFGSFSLEGTTLENISVEHPYVAEALTLTGNALANSITGSSANDVIIGGAGNDTLTGAAGADTYSFFEGNGKDLITTVEAGETIKIDNTTGVEIGTDLLFYTDEANNLYIDYTDGALNSDIVKITAGQYNDSAWVQIGDDSISIYSIINNLGSYETMTSTEISALTYADKAEQFATLTWSE